MSSERLGAFLREVSNWTWDEFCRAEIDPDYTSNQAIIFGLIRSCAMQKLDAIKASLNRLDGKLKTPIRVEYPKIYYLFPNAKGTELTQFDDGSHGIVIHGADSTPPAPVLTPSPEDIIDAISPLQDAPVPESDLATMSLRETLTEMAEYPRSLPDGIVHLAHETEQWVAKQGPQPPEIPKVKSVVAAHLLVMAQNRNTNAITEVFDQIDGKLVETLQILGEDIFITSYALEAPAGAYKNDDGILQLEATASQKIWERKLGKIDE